ncbi:MAG: hypothetical protein RL391_518 [Actinomycetota bacterium]|jgi:poly-gamma-glutamate synthesis protein (capsule biosynthesis protein)
MRRSVWIAMCLIASACSSGGSRKVLDSTPVVPTGSASSKPAVTTSTVAAPVPIAVTFAFTGDTLIHSPLWAAAREFGEPSGLAYDFGPMFADIGPLITGADYAICHLETPFAPPGVQLSTMPKYQVPTEVALALADAGYDRCSTASNHTMDGGVASIDHTVSALLEAGITQAGMARTPEEIEPTVVNVNGLAVSHLSYTIHFNGLSLPADEPWRSARIDIERILDDAKTTRNMGAEFVIVSMHWGNEGSSRPNPNQKDWSEKLAASGLIDIIVGSHPHVLQPIERVGDMWVLNSLGNFISAMPTGDKWPPSTQDGAVVLVEVSGVPGGRFHVGRPEVVPTWVDRDHGFVVRDVRRWLGDHPDDREVGESLRRTLAVMGDFMESP